MTEIPVVSNQIKKDSAQRAQDKVRDLIYYGEFSEEDAYILGSLWLAYEAAAYLHIEDLEYEKESPYIDFANAIRNRRLEIEGLLFPAQEHGDYSLVKRELLTEAASYKDMTRYDDWFGRLSGQIEKLVAIMHNSNKHFRPPVPTWLGSEQETA